MSNWFNFGSKNTENGNSGTPEPQAIRALPSSWYRSDAMYQLERRSIFSKKWLLITHSTRLQREGEYVRVTEAGFTFFVIKDRAGNIRAHHNVCRHRAFPLVHEDCGKLSILACKYHGWSYGFDGKLAKAPKYQELPSFDKSSNGLFSIHTHIDKLGFVWVNLEAGETPSVAWEDDFAGVDLQERLQQYDLSEYNFDHQWEMNGNYNWKTLADNYNECYHCPTGHPAVNSFSNLSKYWVETACGHIQHFNVDRDDLDADKSPAISSTFYYPNASITVSPVFFFIQRCCPISATQTSMQYEVYRHKDASDEKFNHIDQLFKQVMGEDKDLCNGAQANLNAGVFTNGELHPRVEKGPLYFQAVTRKIVMDHRQQEEENEYGEIWPATPKHALSDANKEDINFCSKLDCESSKLVEGLSW